MNMLGCIRSAEFFMLVILSSQELDGVGRKKIGPGCENNTSGLHSGFN